SRRAGQPAGLGLDGLGDRRAQQADERERGGEHGTLRHRFVRDSLPAFVRARTRGGMTMLRRVLAVAMLLTSSVAAQEPVRGVANPEALFTDRNPALHANKQAALHIMKDLLQCNRWDEADKWLTARYVQHNPNVASGRDPVVKFFSSRPKTPTCETLT